MKSKIQLLPLFVLMFALTFTSCKKKDAADDSSQYGNVTDDATRVNNETDNAANDANTALEGSASFSGGRLDGGSICDATVTYDTTTHTATITYNGVTCDQRRTRSGSITVQLTGAKHWKDAGASVTITFNAFTIKRLSDSKSIVINGSKTITNVTGGLLKDIANGPITHITHTITSSGLSITFDNGSQRTWSITKQRDFTYNGGVVIAASGTGADGLAISGSNRFGNPFSYTITPGQPLVFNQSCNWQCGSGQVVFGKLIRTVTVTFGLDASGNPTSCPAFPDSYYFKATWTNAKGVAESLTHSY